MGRKERRALERENKKHLEEDKRIQIAFNTIEYEKRLEKEIHEKVLNEVLALLLVLPMEVLMDHFWSGSYKQKIPKFIDYVLEYYQKWSDGELDIEEMKKDLWEYAGVRLEAVDE